MDLKNFLGVRKILMKDERYGNRGGRSGGSRSGMRRGGGGGRYSRY